MGIRNKEPLPHEGRPYYTWEQMRERLAELSRREAARPWLVRKARRAWWAWSKRIWPDWKPRALYHRARTRWQRSKRGWADRDVWGFDAYIARVLSEGIAHLAETGHSWPHDGQWPTFESWQEYLRDLSARLGTWNDSTFHDAEAYAVTQAAVEEFGKHLGNFWD